ncbi:PD-(D/E)XK nuclease family protein [Candidatus Pacearchaeota archaeon]|nr:PD-(D/E)XK nuclease family protein [Candidatus Pacearchaeota archaeon]
MADPGKMSATKMTTYQGCSMAYYLKYVRHEKVASNINLVFGREIHHMLEHFYDTNFKSSDSFAGAWRFRWGASIAGDFLKGKAKAELKTRGIPYKATNKETTKTEERTLIVGSHTNLYNFENPLNTFFGLMKLGNNILSMFYARHIVEKDGSDQTKKPPVEVERGFGNKKEEPIKVGDHLVLGYIDRIDERNGNWFITDYKTDKRGPENNPFTLHRHPQFTLYSHVFRELFGIVEKAILYYHLRSGKVFETHRSENDFDYLKRTLDQVVEGIIKDKFNPFYGFHCNFCDYQVPCEKYTIDYHGGPRIDLEGRIKQTDEFHGFDDTPEWMIDQTEER